MENGLLKNTGAFLQKEKKKKVIKERNFIYSELKKICEFIMDMGFLTISFHMNYMKY